MGNTGSTPNSPSTSRGSGINQDSSSKEIHIRTDHPDGFYFTGEILSGTFEIPISFVQQHFGNRNNRKPSDIIRRKSIDNAVQIELVGDAIYSSEVDAAADSDGHASHRVNVCRHRCLMTINADQDRCFSSSLNQMETSFDQTNPKLTDSPNLLTILPQSINGTFEIQIPDGLPPTLNNNRSPSVSYTLELNLSSSRYRYQIPLSLSSRGSIPYPMIEQDLSTHMINQHDLCLQANLFRQFYYPGEEIPVRVTYSNPQQRSIRSITVTLHQFYRIHHDQYHAQLDGKEWTLDHPTLSSQREWIGEVLLQLPSRPLPASYKINSVGTTQTIECELDYRIVIELNEKRGDDIQLTLPPIEVTYQTSSS